MAHAREQGYQIARAGGARPAHEAALQHSPVAAICDTIFPDGRGSDVLSAFRRDYLLRETPFILVPGAEVSQRGEPAIASVLRGLAAILTPGCRLYHDLSGKLATAKGFVEQIGVGRLLQTLAALGATGRLALARKDDLCAELWLDGGKIGSAKAGAAVGHAAITDIVGLEWREYSFEQEGVCSDLGAEGAQRTGAIVQAARQENNALLERVFREGASIDGIEVEEASLDQYLETVPAVYLEALVQAAEGEPLLSLAQGHSEPALRSMLHEMRRAGVLRLRSHAVVEGRDGRGWSLFAAKPERSTLNAVASGRLKRRKPGGRRLMVVLMACLVTLAIVGGGLVLALRDGRMHDFARRLGIGRTHPSESVSPQAGASPDVAGQQVPTTTGNE